MKRIDRTTFPLLAAALLSLASCERAGNAMTSISMKGLRAEALPGKIKLSWDQIQDSDFLYVNVSYFDFATLKTRSTLCSRYTTSLVVEGLLNKYGEYDFTFTVYDKDGAAGQPVHILRQCGKAEPYYVTDSETEIAIDKSQLATNAQEPGEGPIECLVDDDLDTFFQSFWDEYSHPELKPSGYHYFTVDLMQDVSSVILKYWNRRKGGSRPQKVNLYTSVEGETWKLIACLDNLPSDPGSSFTSDLLLSEEPFRHLKFEVVKGTDVYQPFFSIAEFKVINVVRKLVDPEAD